MIDFHMQSRLADKFPPDNFPPGGTCPKWNLSGGKLSGIHMYKKMYIPDQTYSPTLRPKGAQKPSN